jgi:hypothetical protein
MTEEGKFAGAAGDAKLLPMSTLELRIARPPTQRATKLQIWRGRLRELLGAALKRLGVPGAVAESEINDPATGDHVEIRVSHLFTRISINGRDYYFDRMTGRYDGTGMGCR